MCMHCLHMVFFFFLLFNNGNEWVMRLNETDTKVFLLKNASEVLGELVIWATCKYVSVCVLHTAAM